MTIRQPYTMLEATSVASSVGSWIEVDEKYDEYGVRAFYGTLTSGDTVYIDGSFETSDTSADADYGTLDVFTTVSFTGLINGPWRRLRARKTGSTGPASVKGNL